MMIGALGDIHGDFASVRQIQAQHPEVALWLCVGDVADEDWRYEPLPVPVHFIKGNNDGYDAIASGTLPDNLHFIENGRLTQLAGLHVAGLGGTQTVSERVEDLPLGEAPQTGRAIRR